MNKLFKKKKKQHITTQQSHLFGKSRHLLIPICYRLNFNVCGFSDFPCRMHLSLVAVHPD